MAGWFDRLARSTAERSESRASGSEALTSRRRFLRNAAVAAGGAAAAVVVGTQPALAACPAGQRNCGGVCVNTSCDPRHCGSCDDVCGPNQICVGGDCRGCPNGQFACGTGCSKTCVDRLNDSANCGGCGNACPAGSKCCGGVCCNGCCDSSNVCQPGNTVAHCGSQGNVCVTCGAGNGCFGSVCGAGV